MLLYMKRKTVEIGLIILMVKRKNDFECASSLFVLSLSNRQLYKQFFCSLKIHFKKIASFCGDSIQIDT